MAVRHGIGLDDVANVVADAQLPDQPIDGLDRLRMGVDQRDLKLVGRELAGQGQDQGGVRPATWVEHLEPLARKAAQGGVDAGVHPAQKLKRAVYLDQALGRQVRRNGQPLRQPGLPVEVRIRDIAPDPRDRGEDRVHRADRSEDSGPIAGRV